MEELFSLPLPLAGASLLILVVSIFLLFIKQRKSAVSNGKPASKQIDVVASSEADNRPSVRILFGTQTGTAERFSKQLGNELRRKYGDAINVEVLDLEHYVAELRLPKEGVAFFLLATYGDGDPTDNAVDFYSWLCLQADAVNSAQQEPSLQVGGDACWGCPQCSHAPAEEQRQRLAWRGHAFEAAVWQLELLIAAGAKGLVSWKCERPWRHRWHSATSNWLARGHAGKGPPEGWVTAGGAVEV